MKKECKINIVNVRILPVIFFTAYSLLFAMDRHPTTCNTRIALVPLILETF